MTTRNLIRRIIAKATHTKKTAFILSVAFLKPNTNPGSALHRRLFILSCRRPIDLAINLMAYLRWVGYYTWVSSYKACKSRTDAQLQEYGFSRLTLFCELVKLGLMHTIAPRYYFLHQFYRPYQAKKILSYVYNQQLPYFHDHSNRHFKRYKQAAELISNKYLFSCALQNTGIPTVSSECYNTHPLIWNPELLLQKKTMFCKPNNASQSRDAFLIDYDSGKDTYQLVPIQGKVLSTLPEIKCYLKEIAERNNTLLLQPAITDHPEIKKIASQQAAATVRIITEKSATLPHTMPQLLYLQLQIPSEKKPDSHTQSYNILPLNLNTLDIDSTFKTKPYFLKRHDIILSEELKSLLRTSIDYCIEAHRLILDLRTVAFDLIIGEQGPVILEANYNWSIEMLYNVIQTTPLNYQDTHPAARWLNQIILSIM